MFLFHCVFVIIGRCPIPPTALSTANSFMLPFAYKRFVSLAFRFSPSPVREPISRSPGGWLLFSCLSPPALCSVGACSIFGGRCRV